MENSTFNIQNRSYRFQELNETTDKEESVLNVLQRQETDNYPYMLPLHFTILMILLYGIVIVIGIGGNVLVFWTISSVKALRTVTNFFLASLCISDITMSLICIPTTILTNIVFHYWVLGDLLCPMIQFIQLVVVLQRTFAMVVITIDRHYIISNPLKKRMTRQKARLIILILWLLSALLALPSAIHSRIIYLPYEPGVNGLCVEYWQNTDLKYIYSLTILIFQYFLPLLIMSFAYLHIGFMIWFRPTPGEADRKRDKRIEMSKRKSLKMMFTVVLVYGLTWLPLHILTIIGDVNPQIFNNMSVHILWLIFHWVAFSNSGLNPIIYCWMNRSFRNRFRRLFCFKLCTCATWDKLNSFRNYAMNDNSKTMIGSKQYRGIMLVMLRGNSIHMAITKTRQPRCLEKNFTDV